MLDARGGAEYLLFMPATNTTDTDANFLALCALMGEEVTPELVTRLETEAAASAARFAAEKAEADYQGFLADARRHPGRFADYGRDHSMWARSAE